MCDPTFFLHRQDQDQIEKEVTRRFRSDFSFIPLPALEKTYSREKLQTHIVYPEQYVRHPEMPLYPGWETLYEAKSKFLSDLLLEKANELARIGIFLIKLKQKHTLMFLRGFMGDAWALHWIPLYCDVLKWV